MDESFPILGKNYTLNSKRIISLSQRVEPGHCVKQPMGCSRKHTMTLEEEIKDVVYEVNVLPSFWNGTNISIPLSSTIT
jgi:hypothetical protein